MHRSDPAPEPAIDERGATLADRAYLRLREEIIRVDLAPGTLLRDDDLMARMGIGRTPVREAVAAAALRRLRHDPRRAAGRSCPRSTSPIWPRSTKCGCASSPGPRGWPPSGSHPSDRGEIAVLVEALGAVSADDGFGTLLDLDRRVHRFVYRCAKNAYLARTLDLYHDLSLRILYIAMKRYPSLTPRLEDVVHEQRTVLEAIGRGDAETAERVAVAHIAKFEGAIRQVI